jgi:hypothetical protein
MTRKDYEALAVIVGQTLAEAHFEGGEELRTKIYDSLYRPLTDHLSSDNPRFDELKFAAAVARTEFRYVGTK